MLEPLYLERTDVYLLVDWDDGHDGGHVRLVVCEHQDGLSYATRLANSLGVPVSRDPQPAVLPARPVRPERQAQPVRLAPPVRPGR